MKTLRLIAIALAFVIGGSAFSLAADWDHDHDRDRDWKQDQKERKEHEKDRRKWEKEREKEWRERERWRREHGYYRNGQYGPYQQYPNGTYRYPNGTYPNGTYRYPNTNYPYGYPNRTYGRYPNGTYGNGGYGNGMGVAQRFGYQDGVNEGANDRATGHSFRPTHDRGYQLATNGYQPAFGNRDQYKAAYRQAYTQGYQQGYYGNNRGVPVWPR